MASRNITTVKFVTEMMKNENLPIWRAYHSDGKTSLCFQTKNIPLNDSIDMLRDVVKNTSGIMVLKLYKDPDTANDPKKNQYSFYEYTIDMDDDREGSGGRSQDNGIGSMSGGGALLPMYLDQMAKTFQLQLEKNTMELKHQRDLEIASKSSEQLKNQMQMKVLDRIMNLLDGKKGAPVAGSETAKAVSGTTASQQPKPEDKAAKAKVAETLNTLRKDDPDFYKKLAKLAEMKVKNPSMYGIITDSLNDLEL